MANRVTQVAREVLQQGGNPKARVTQVVREVLVQLGTITLSLEDDLNLWSDLVASSLVGTTTNLTVSLTESLTFTDALSTFGIYNLTLTDSLNLWAESASLLNNSLLNVQDNLNSWQDSTSFILGLLVDFNESLSFQDAVKLYYSLLLNAQDNLNDWQDAVEPSSSTPNLSLQLFDSLDFSDAILISFNGTIGLLLQLFESLSFQDAILLSVIVKRHGASGYAIPLPQEFVPLIKSEAQRRKLQAMLDAVKDTNLPENYSPPKPYHFGD